MKTQYLALLRGINVGGKNIIKKDKLKSAFEDLGLEKVQTYIQSGNVVFYASSTNKELLMKKIEKQLSILFNFDARIVLLSERELEKMITGAPRGFGTKPTEYRYDVIFLKAPLTATEALLKISLKEGVDEIHGKPGVLYFSRLEKRVTQSYVSKIVMQPMYKFMTIRNWNTTIKLLDLMKKS